MSRDDALVSGGRGARQVPVGKRFAFGLRRDETRREKGRGMPRRMVNFEDDGPQGRRQRMSPGREKEEAAQARQRAFAPTKAGSSNMDSAGCTPSSASCTCSRSPGPSRTPPRRWLPCRPFPVPRREAWGVAKKMCTISPVSSGAAPNICIPVYVRAHSRRGVYPPGAMHAPEDWFSPFQNQKNGMEGKSHHFSQGDFAAVGHVKRDAGKSPRTCTQMALLHSRRC